MRGVHFISRWSQTSRRGSSPHARGPQSWQPLRRLSARFIPACAGSTYEPHYLHCTPGVHPRMRGVHSSPNPMCKTSVGSSPHARGPPVFIKQKPRKRRFIPACAGSTVTVLSMALAGQVHPRMRGVHFTTTGSQNPNQGSSPHARGPRWFKSYKCYRRRFIPACAGSTNIERIKG